jgi:hypothetical protein
MEFLQLRETVLGLSNAPLLPGARLRCQLAFQLVLLITAEVTRRRSQVRIATHPLGGEVVEKLIYIIRGAYARRDA